MASENIDLVRPLYAAWERGDWSSVGWADPQIEFVVADGPDRSGVTGVEKLGEGWGRFLDAWEDYRVEAQEYMELDEERVLVFIRIAGRGKASGLEVGQMGADAANLMHVRNGKVTRLVLYWDRKQALADAGLDAGSGSRSV